MSEAEMKMLNSLNEYAKGTARFFVYRSGSNLTPAGLQLSSEGKWELALDNYTRVKNILKNINQA